MKKFRFSILFISIAALLTGCTSTFAGSVFVFSFKDMVLYVLIAFIIAILISFQSSGKTKNIFWIWFILNLLLTPLIGFIYLLVKVSKKID